MPITTGQRFSSQHQELRQLRLESPIRRIDSLPRPPVPQLSELSVNPRLRDVVISDEGAVWSLRVLALPAVPPFEKLESQTLAILARINEGAKNAPPGDRQKAAQTARDRLRAAYLFLRWPQNRELAAEALKRFSGERPQHEHIPSPSFKERLYGIVGSALQRLETNGLSDRSSRRR